MSLDRHESATTFQFNFLMGKERQREWTDEKKRRRVKGNKGNGKASEKGIRKALLSDFSPPCCTLTESCSSRKTFNSLDAET